MMSAWESRRELSRRRRDQDPTTSMPVLPETGGPRPAAAQLAGGDPARYIARAAILYAP